MANPRNPDQQSQYDPDTDYDDDDYYCGYDDTPPPSEYGCDPLPPGPKAPKLPKPKKCKPECECPTPPEQPHTCFDKMIARQDNIINRAKHAGEVRDNLDKLNKQANAATQKYTRQLYHDFRKRWRELDKEIVNAIEIVTCNTKCWWCVLECHFCPELYRIRWIEERLYGNSTLIGDVHSLQDLKHWYDCNVDAKQRTVDRISAVVNAWNDPATTIDAALTKNEQLVGTIRGLDQAEGLRTVFFDILPRHIAIAPRDVDSPRDINTAIEKKYLDLCSACDPDPTPDDCCGPDVSLPSVRQRLIPPQAFIVEPSKYFQILCCLITQRFEPAQRQLENATAIRDQIQADIDSLTAELAKRLTDPLANFKANIVLPIDCDKYNGGDGDGCGCDDDSDEDQPRRRREEQAD